MTAPTRTPVDFFIDGSGSGNCFQGNDSSTFAPDSVRAESRTSPALPELPGPGDPAEPRRDRWQLGNVSCSWSSCWRT